MSIVLLFSFLFTLGCSSVYVDVDYDRAHDFSTYKKYKWINQKDKDPSKSEYKNDLNRKRFALAIESNLKAKGFTRTKDDDFDFSVVYHLRFEKKLDVTSYGYKYYPATGYKEQYVQTRTYEQGSIIFDVVDKNNKILVWRGVAEGVLYESNDPEYIINRSIEAILRDFPPTK